MGATKLWSRSFILAIASKTFSSVVFTLLSTTIAAYALDSMGVGAGLAGIAAGAYVLVSVPSRIIAGRFTDRFGRKRFLLVGTFFYFLFTLAYFIPMGIVGLIVVRAVHGFFHGWSSNVHATVAIDCIPQERMGEGIGYLSLSTTISTGLGPFVGIILLQAGSYTAMFAVCALLSFLALVLLLFMDVREVEVPEGYYDAGRKFAVSDYFETKAIPLSTVILIVCTCSSCVTAFLAPYASQEGASGAAPFFFLLFAVVIAFSRPLFGKLMDRKGDNAAACPSLAAFILALAVLGFSLQGWTLLVVAVLAALGYGTLSPCIQAMVTKGVPPYRVGVATSTFFVFTDLGLGMGPTLGGTVASFAGYSTLYLACAVLMVAATALYWFVHGRTAETKRCA